MSVFCRINNCDRREEWRSSIIECRLKETGSTILSTKNRKEKTQDDHSELATQKIWNQNLKQRHFQLYQPKPMKYLHDKWKNREDSILETDFDLTDSNA